MKSWSALVSPSGIRKRLALFFLEAIPDLSLLLLLMMAEEAYIPPHNEVFPKSPNLTAPLLPPPVWDGKNGVVKDNDVDPILTSAAP